MCEVFYQVSWIVSSLSRRSSPPKKSGFSRLLQLLRKHRSMCNPTLLVLLILVSSCSSVSTCPAQCLCENTVVNCSNQNLRSIPQALPEDTSTLYMNGNNIRNLNNNSFPVLFQHLTHLHMSGCHVEELDSMTLKNLPRLHFLDLSDNNISQFNIEAVRQDNNIEVVNLSNSLYNHSYIHLFTDLFNHSLPKVLHLDLSNNDLIFLPEAIFTGLPRLSVLDLRNNSLVSFRNITFGDHSLKKLDLRDNAFKNLPNSTLSELSSIQDLQVSLSGNPWRCNCDIEDMLIWLKRPHLVEDSINLTCVEPRKLKSTPLLHLEPSHLPCWSDADVLDQALEPSYVFLGLVLALIGVIFLLVLYLNKKGIKRWMYNIRDACRDHMEGYHYRYETNTDPRLANLSLNSDL